MIIVAMVCFKHWICTECSGLFRVMKNTMYYRLWDYQNTEISSTMVCSNRPNHPFFSCVLYRWTSMFFRSSCMSDISQKNHSPEPASASMFHTHLGVCAYAKWDWNSPYDWNVITSPVTSGIESWVGPTVCLPYRCIPHVLIYFIMLSLHEIGLLSIE